MVLILNLTSVPPPEVCGIRLLSVLMLLCPLLVSKTLLRGQRWYDMMLLLITEDASVRIAMLRADTVETFVFIPLLLRGALLSHVLCLPMLVEPCISRKRLVLLAIHHSG